jgi:aldehyde:ferredoxin oxidoreductase
MSGKLLYVDLSTGEMEDRHIAEEEIRAYLLGSGLAAKIYYDMLDPDVDPLDPANPLIVINGLLSGTISPTGCRSSWCHRSPLTGIWNEANMGGHWGAELRFAGYDGLVITGKAEKPTYLYIKSEKQRGSDDVETTLELRDASHLWGTDHFECYDRLLEETDPKARAATIGPAGERLVKVSSVMQGGHSHARTAARGGVGAVMGSKNLKAIVVRGNHKPEYFDFQEFRQYVKEGNNWLKEQDAVISLSLVGTAGGMPATDTYGDLPIQNWRGGNWTEGANKVNGKQMHETDIFTKHTFCYACPIGCGKAVEITEGKYAGTWGEGAEYETMGGFAGNLGCDDLNAVSKMNDLCNRYGLDTISASAVLAFAFECYEKGIIDKEMTGGVELEWGDADAIIAMLEKLNAREDIGDLLAEGVRAAAKEIGNGAEEFAIHVKGMEFPYHDPRGFVGMAANYATANRGACHLESISYWRGYGIEWKGWEEGEADEWREKHRFDNSLGGQQAYAFQNYMSVYNPLGLCKFIIKGSYTPDQVAGLVNRALGWEWTGQDVLDMGERLFNLKRLINVRLGITRADDVLPRRFLEEPRPTGSAAGVLPDLELQLKDYYERRHWDENGIPTNDAPLPEGMEDIDIPGVS